MTISRPLLSLRHATNNQTAYRGKKKQREKPKPSLLFRHALRETNSDKLPFVSHQDRSGKNNGDEWIQKTARGSMHVCRPSCVDNRCMDNQLRLCCMGTLRSHYKAGSGQLKSKATSRCNSLFFSFLFPSLRPILLLQLSIILNHGLSFIPSIG